MSLKSATVLSRAKAFGFIKIVLLSYVICSVALSVSIIGRLALTIDPILRISSVFAYLFFFFFIPILAVFYLVNSAVNEKKWLACVVNSCFLFFYVLLLAFDFIFPFFSIPEYLFLWFPIPILVIKYAEEKPTSRLRTKKYSAVISLALILVVVLPNIAALIGTNAIINQTSAIENESEKVSFIFSHVEGMTAFGWMPRAYNDYWKFVLSGAGSCGEMAMANTNLMTASGLEVRTVSIAGENHELVEVNTTGKWKVADSATITTREEWAQKRISDVGALTYVSTVIENSFLELTQEYVNNSDTIVIKVLRNGQPVPNAEVQLKHTFVTATGSLICQLPNSDRSFITNVNGTVSLHLGKPYYIGEFKESEPFYWVFVNGENQSRTVTSTGTGIIQPILEVPLT